MKKSLYKASIKLAKEWHPTKNGDLTPDKVSCWSKKTVWWLCSYDDPNTGKHFDFEWQARIDKRFMGADCPFLSGKAVWPGFNDLETVNPEIASQWHPKKNGNLTARDVTAHSGEKVWWLFPYDDPITGKHFDFEWEATVCKRVSGRQCPFLTGKAVWPGFNDFASKAPKIAGEWSTRNKRSASETLAYSNKKVWWIVSYDDPITGKHFDFEWEASPASRIKNPGCPFLSSQRIWKGFNDLATVNPKLAAEWHPTKNEDLKAEDVMPNSRRKVWWYLPYIDEETGELFEFDWQATVYARNSGDGCPFLSGQAVWPGFNDLATKAPDIAREWHPTKNRGLTPDKVAWKSNKKVWWRCPICGRSYRMAISHRTCDGSGCKCIS